MRPSAEQIHTLREGGLTLTEIGERYGVTRQTIVNWRDGKRPAPPSCPECGISMRQPASRCGLCTEERRLGLVAA